MPGFNGTGPEGKGPLTGRGAGNCNTTRTTVNQPRNGLGLGALFGGFGRGRRMRLFGGRGGRRGGGLGPGRGRRRW